jgi:type I restriction enzyme R subunit
LFKNFEAKVKSRDVDSVPSAFDGNPHAQAYYGTFRLALGEDHFSQLGQAESEIFIKRAFEIDEVVRKAVSTHSLSPQNIEAEIKKALLPKLFADLGLDKAKDVIERVIQITRIGLSRGVYE